MFFRSSPQSTFNIMGIQQQQHHHHQRRARASYSIYQQKQHQQQQYYQPSNRRTNFRVYWRMEANRYRQSRVESIAAAASARACCLLSKCYSVELVRSFVNFSSLSPCRRGKKSIKIYFIINVWYITLQMCMCVCVEKVERTVSQQDGKMLYVDVN